MITQKDIKALKLHETRMGRISSWAPILGFIILVVVGVLNLKLASNIGSTGGYSLKTLFYSWVQGFDASQQYPGIYLLGIERLETALLQFGMAVFMAVFFNSLTNAATEIHIVAKFEQFMQWLRGHDKIMH